MHIYMYMYNAIVFVISVTVIYTAKKKKLSVCEDDDFPTSEACQHHPH